MFSEHAKMRVRKAFSIYDQSRLQSFVSIRICSKETYSSKATPAKGFDASPALLYTEFAS